MTAMDADDDTLIYALGDREHRPETCHLKAINQDYLIRPTQGTPSTPISNVDEDVAPTPW